MKNVRFQYEVSTDKAKVMDELMSKCDLSTKKELFDNAFTLLIWAIQESEKGNEIASISKDDNKLYILKTPAISNAYSKESRTH